MLVLIPLGCAAGDEVIFAILELIPLGCIGAGEEVGFMVQPLSFS